jgi:hypothetical protein
LIGQLLTYRVSGKSGIGMAIAVIVATADGVIAKLAEFREDGFGANIGARPGRKPVDAAEFDRLNLRAARFAATLLLLGPRPQRIANSGGAM